MKNFKKGKEGGGLGWVVCRFNRGGLTKKREVVFLRGDDAFYWNEGFVKRKLF